MVEMLGAALGGVGGAVYKLFGYNRGNFMQDREQRAIMEYQLLEARLTQVGLWRQDVRDAIQLTPQKMEVYLTVIALELTASLTCLCKGRVPAGAPPWLVSSGVLAVCSAQTFLFLGLWFGLHAFVASQAYKVRILTQLVRLPIPTWAHMEAARTYGSDFESMKTKQMLRVPLITGSQESHVRQRAGQRADPSAMAADPWGLERQGEGIMEVDSEVNGSMIEKQRHVWLIRESAKFFNTYDAFCRVCLSVGTSSLSIFFCFFCLAYVCTELAAPVGAWAGMIIFSSITLLLLRTDQILQRSQYFIGSFCLFFAPVFCAVVTFLSSKSWGNPGSIEYLVPIGLFLEGCWYIYFLHLINASEHQTGAVLPRSFRAVLYVDAFGWAKHTSTFWQQAQSKVFSSRRFLVGNSGSDDAPSKNKLPATLCAGAGRPMRPEDAKREVSAVAKGLLVANPAEFREQVSDDEDDNNDQGHGHTPSFRPGTFASFKKTDEDQDDYVDEDEDVGSGADIVGEKAGIQPWRAFFWTTALLAVMWWCAAFVALYDVQTGASEFRTGSYGIKPGEVLPMEALLGTKVTTSWGGAFSEPHGFACDTDGNVFATAGRDADGHRSVLEGSLQNERLEFVSAPTCGDLPESAMIQDIALHNCDGLSKQFCSAVVLPLGGTQLVSCPMSVSMQQKSSSLVAINDRSNATQQVSMATPMLRRSWLEDRGGSPMDEHLGLGHLLHPEEMTALSAVPCDAGSKQHSCLVVGTTARRIVHLSGNGTDSKDPSWLPRRLLQKEGLEVPGPGSFAVLGGGRYLGVLHRDANTVHILDMHAGGLAAGIWKLPSPAQATKTGTGGHFSGICAAGNSLYALQSGATPSVWRFAHPKLPEVIL